MLSIAVCDDEILDCCRLSAKIKRFLCEMKRPFLLHQFQSGRDLLKAPENFDIIFLDILMDGLDGMKTAELFRQKSSDCLLIFISASRNYVFKAYDVEAFQYLVKPVRDEKLKQVLKKAVLKIQPPSQGFILASRERQTVKLFLEHIYYFEISGRKITVHGSNGIFTYYERIGNLEDSLRGRDFFRCHKSYLVNLNYITVYNHQEIILDNGEHIPIAKRRYEAFCGEILACMKKNGGIL